MICTNTSFVVSPVLTPKTEMQPPLARNVKGHLHIIDFILTRLEREVKKKTTKLKTYRPLYRDRTLQPSLRLFKTKYTNPTNTTFENLSIALYSDSSHISFLNMVHTNL